MNRKLFRHLLVLFALLTVLTISTCSSAVITFDDIADSGRGSLITNGYQGLDWTNFAVLNASIDESVNGLSGYFYGMVTISNVALNAAGFPAEIDARGTNFNFLSTYLTGAWRSNLSIEVRGFRSGSLLYDQTVVASATNPTSFTFNYVDIDRLTFNSFGGDFAGFGGTANQFVMDNFNFEFVPEPSAFLLTAAGALMLAAARKRKRG